MINKLNLVKKNSNKKFKKQQVLKMLLLYKDNLFINQFLIILRQFKKPYYIKQICPRYTKKVPQQFARVPQYFKNYKKGYIQYEGPVERM